MKRYISLLIALVLLVSMFALPTFAFAEGDPEESEEPARDVGFSTAAFAQYVIEENKGLYVNMSEDFKLNQDWLKDEAKVHALFTGDINYLVLPEERTEFEDDEEKYTITYSNGQPEEDDEDEAEATPVADEYYAGQHVTLKGASTFTAEDGYEFVGWLVKVQYNGTDSDNEEQLLYRAGDQFVMPEHDIEVVAYWYQKEVADETAPDDEAQATAEEEKLEFTYPKNDIIYLEYITPSDDPRDGENWQRIALSSNLKLQSSGWWMFRYAVADGENGDITDDDAVLTVYDTEEFKEAIKTENGGVFSWELFCLKRYAVDSSHPELALSEAMKNKQEDGLTVGVAYAVSTALTITDSSTTTTTYKVYRHSGDGAENEFGDGWVEIYDSSATTDKVLEGGELYISSTGVITPISSDVTVSGLYRYKIVYSVKDAEGYFGVVEENGTTEYHPVLLLGVHYSTEDEQTLKRMEAWKIALFVIAGLAAAGIVALLLIRPKRAVVGDARISALSENADKDNNVADASPDDKTDGKE